MANPNAKAFGDLLKKAIRKIAEKNNQNVGFTQSFIANEINVTGSAIRYWGNGKIPADDNIVLQLADLLSKKGGFQDSAEKQRFLRLAGIPITYNSTQTSSKFSKARLPITDPLQFYGRNLQISYLFDGLKKMSSMAIYGPRRSGKSSLLNMTRAISTADGDSLRPNQRKEKLPNASDYCWVDIDFQDERVKTSDGFFRTILKGMKIPVPEHCSGPKFLELVADQVFSPTVILIDELEAGLMSPELNTDFWDNLRYWSANQSNGKVMFITASVMPPKETSEDYHKPSSFFNVFRLIYELEPLNNDEARAMICSFDVLPLDADWIYKISHGWPALIRIICDVHQYSMEQKDQTVDWQKEAVRQIQPLSYLWETQNDEK